MASLKLVRYKPTGNIGRNPNDIFDPDKGVGDLKPSFSEIGVGGIAYMRGKQYRVVEAERKANCFGCDLLVGGICQKITKHPCSAYSRTDQTWVVFKAIPKNESSK